MEPNFPFKSNSDSEYFDELVIYLTAVSRRLPPVERAELSETLLTLASLRENRLRAPDAAIVIGDLLVLPATPADPVKACLQA